MCQGLTPCLVLVACGTVVGIPSGPEMPGLLLCGQKRNLSVCSWAGRYFQADVPDLLSLLCFLLMVCEG